MTTHPIRDACDILFSPGQVVEIRALGKWGMTSGYFDDFDKLTAAVRTIDNKGEYKGIYFTLNPVNPALLARRANRIPQKLGKDDPTTSDQDIVSRRWLPIDIDPTRPAEISSSDEEHTAAKIKACHIAEYLTGLGWPEPIVADSGNGAHLLYRVDLPNDPGSLDLIKSVLGTLHTLFSDDICKVDVSNSNSSRIWKLYGTTSRKGDHIPQRPHRVSQILSVPDEIQTVTTDQLTQLAGMFPAEEPPKPTSKDRYRGETIDLGDWLSRHGLAHEEKPYGSGRLFVFDECPFSAAHKDGAYAIQFSNGAIFAGCHHNSCGGGAQRWPELRERFEGTIEQRLKNLKKSRSSDKERMYRGEEGASEASDRPAATQVPDDIKTEATRILREGSPLPYMLETFARDHIGDPVVAECLVMSLASRQVINAKGLHVSVTGQSGKGKSHSFDTMLQQVPEDLKLAGRMSDKALFYIKGMQPGTVIVLDDVSLSDQMQEVLKGVTTSFKKPFEYRTVNKDRQGETCVIPERCVWWVAKVDGTGDDQVWNRMLTCWIDDSVDQDARVLEQTLAEAASIPTMASGIRREALVCQEMWRQLQQVHVVIPFAEKIRFSSNANRRNPDMLLDLVKAHAVLMQHQREMQVASEMPYITATVEDFRAACRLYTQLNGSSGGQQTKLTRDESALVDAIRSYGRAEITIAELQHITGMSQSVVYKMIHGATSRGNHYSGLLEKCPALSFCDRTLVVSEGEQASAHRRSKAYSWDEQVYAGWASDGGCWLDGYGPDEGSPAVGNSALYTSSGIAEGSGVLAEISARSNGHEIAPIVNQKKNNKNNFCTDTSSGKSEHMKQQVCDPAGEHVHTSAPEFSARRYEGSETENTGVPVFDSGQLNDSGTFRYSSAERGDLPLEPPPAGAARPGNSSEIPKSSPAPGPTPPSPCRLQSDDIKPRDFIAVENGGYAAGPCDCCGSKWVNFRERMTRERMARPAETSKKICKRCYDTARKKEAATFRTLPGLLDPDRMRKMTMDLGRCYICDQQKAVWYDPERNTALCEICYQNARTGGDTQQ